MSFAVGEEIAKRGAILLCGGRDGVMEAACQGAKAAGGLTVGILPGDSPGEGNEFLDVPITTGLGFDFRSGILVHSSDALIMIDGGNGTLGELSAGYLNARPLVVIEGTGGWADRIQGITYEGKYLDERGNVSILYAKTAAEAVEKAIFACSR